MKFHNYLLIYFLYYITFILYTPEILNTNIEQEVQKLTRKYTPQEKHFRITFIILTNIQLRKSFPSTILQVPLDTQAP